MIACRAVLSNLKKSNVIRKLTSDRDKHLYFYMSPFIISFHAMLKAAMLEITIFTDEYITL